LLLIFALPGVPPHAIYRLLWIADQMGLPLFATERLWLHHGGLRSQRWVAMMVTIAFYLTLAFAIWCPASPFRPVGLVGFLLLVGRRQDLQAGGTMALVAIKPQLLHLYLARTAAVASAVAPLANLGGLRAYLRRINLPGGAHQLAFSRRLPPASRPPTSKGAGPAMDYPGSAGEAASVWHFRESRHL